MTNKIPNITGLPTSETFFGIVATVFGGRSEKGRIERSAYDGHIIGDDELCVALPARIPPPRPKVEVEAIGRKVVCDIADIGPWNTDDAYWLREGGRPQAESGRDRRGRMTNRAGIDLSPAAAKAIGIDGKGFVNWRFV